MNADTMLLLARLSWVVSGALLAVLLLRRPLRALAGSAPAYALWLTVPAALLAAMLPAVATQHVAGPLTVLRFDQVAAPALAHVSAAASIPWTALWAAGAGAVAMLAWSALAQYRYVRSLGPLKSAVDGDLHYGDTPDAGPALVGLWRPRVVLPSDFHTRFSAREQALIIAHERAHAQRRDPQANAVLALLQCLFWFHPLMHLAARCFRIDQELACDAAVMRTHAGARRSYAAAMLKTATGVPAPALVHSCHWQSTYPLKERMMSLQQTPPPRTRRVAGRLAIAALVCLSAYAALGARAADNALPVNYAVNLTIDMDGKVSTPIIHTRAGETFRISSSNDAHKWDGEFLLHRLAGDLVQIDSTIKRDGVILSKPKISSGLGETMSVSIGGQGDALPFKMSVAITELPAK